MTYKETNQVMTRRMIADRLTKETGKVMLTAEETRKALGIGRGSALNLLSGVEYVPFGNTRRYLVDNIAGRIMEVKKA